MCSRAYGKRLFDFREGIFINAKRRKILREASSLLETASVLVASALDEEEDALDNMPENLQGSERYEKMEVAVDLLNDASEGIDAVIEKINEAAC